MVQVRRFSYFQGVGFLLFCLEPFYPNVLADRVCKDTKKRRNPLNNYTLNQPALPAGEAGSPATGAPGGTTIEAALERHQGLIHAFIQRHGGGHLSYQEALQAGRIGLWRAILGYDASRGTAFATYAWVAISRTIWIAAAEVSPGPTCWPEVPVVVWDGEAVDERLDRALVSEALYQLVAELPERLHWVIVGRYGLGGRPAQTLAQVGVGLGLTRERVRQLEQEALAWLRHPAHSWRLRQRLDLNTAAAYRWALAQNAALRRRVRRVR
jgi:RNA polymerase sigma factor (sigma-70 family)